MIAPYDESGLFHVLDMNSVVITGWEKGFQKISMTKLIRAYTGYDLAQGKRCVDEILGAFALDVVVLAVQG